MSLAFRVKKPSYWQLIFLQSRVNGARYDGEGLERQKWEWPKNTYFQRRFKKVRSVMSDQRSGSQARLTGAQQLFKHAAE